MKFCESQVAQSFCGFDPYPGLQEVTAAVTRARNPLRVFNLTADGDVFEAPKVVEAMGERLQKVVDVRSATGCLIEGMGDVDVCAGGVEGLYGG